MTLGVICFLPWKCFRVSAFLIVQCARENQSNTGYGPLNLPEGSFSVRSSSPLYYVPNHQTAGRFSFASAAAIQCKIWALDFTSPKTEKMCNAFISLIKKLNVRHRSLLFSFFQLALLFVQNVLLSWWMYCAVTTYLPAFEWICCFYVLGHSGTETLV